jgi:hypothetical protein
MSGKKPSSLGALLSQRDPQLAALAAEARRLDALRRRVARSLPAEAEPHCLGADLKDGVLTLFLDSGAWNTFLHYRQQTLLAELQRSLGEPCKTLKFKVLPEAAAQDPVSRHAAHAGEHRRRYRRQRLGRGPAASCPRPRAALLKKLIP